MDKKKIYQLGIVLLLIVSGIFYVYYYILTKNQAVWWDEAEYLLKAKNIAFSTPETGFWEGRPILFSIILAGLFKIGFSEGSIRLLLLFVSIGTVWLVYLFGKKLYDEKIGLIAGALYASFYLSIFYSMRIMVDVLHLTFGLAGIMCFLSRKKWAVRLSLPLIAIATLIRFPSFLFAIILIIYIFITEGSSAMKNKEYWISAALGLAVGIPYLLWSKIKYGSAFHAISVAGGGATEGITISSGFGILKQYLGTFPGYLGVFLLLIFIISFITLLIKTAISFDLIIKKKAPELNKNILILLFIIIPLFYFSFQVSHYEDRYLIIAFPAIFCCIAQCFDTIKRVIEKRSSSRVAIIIIIIAVIAGSFQLILHSSEITQSRIDSYRQIKESSIWIKEHSIETERIITKSVPQTTYYSERESYSFSNTEQEFDGNFTELKSRYVVVSLFEKYPEWAYTPEFPAKYNLTVARVYESGGQPALIIYEALNNK